MNKKNLSIAVGVVVLVLMLGFSLTGNAQVSFWDNVAERLAEKLAGKVSEQLVEAPLGDMSFGASGTRFRNGISADSTSPSAGQVRGTTLTVTGASTLASATFSSTIGVTATSTFSDDIIIGAGKTAIISTSTPTTTPQLYVGAAAGVATTTLEMGHAQGLDACFQLYENGAAKRLYVNGTSLVVENGMCK